MTKGTAGSPNPDYLRCHRTESNTQNPCAPLENPEESQIDSIKKKTIAAAATKTKQTNIEETRWKLLLLYKSRDWVTGGKEGMGKNRQKSTRMAEENGRESPRMADAVVINLRLH